MYIYPSTLWVRGIKKHRQTDKQQNNQKFTVTAVRPEPTPHCCLTWHRSRWAKGKQGGYDWSVGYVGVVETTTTTYPHWCGCSQPCLCYCCCSFVIHCNIVLRYFSAWFGLVTVANSTQLISSLHCEYTYNFDSSVNGVMYYYRW